MNCKLSGSRGILYNSKKGVLAILYTYQGTNPSLQMLKEIFQDVIHNIFFVLIKKTSLQEGNINLSSNRFPDHDIAKYSLFVNQDGFL